LCGAYVRRCARLCARLCGALACALACVPMRACVLTTDGCRADVTNIKPFVVAALILAYTTESEGIEASKTECAAL
jgi:hypothetical protein